MAKGGSRVNAGGRLSTVVESGSRNTKKTPFNKLLVHGTRLGLVAVTAFGLGRHIGVPTGVKAERARVEHLQKAGFKGKAISKFSILAEIYKLDLSKKEHVDFLRLVNVTAKEVSVPVEYVFYHLEKAPKNALRSEESLAVAITGIRRRNDLTASQKGIQIKILTALMNVAKASGNPKLATDLGTRVRESHGSHSKLVNTFKL